MLFLKGIEYDINNILLDWKTDAKLMLIPSC